jgi:hypothetical protein
MDSYTFKKQKLDLMLSSCDGLRRCHLAAEGKRFSEFAFFLGIQPTLANEA